MAAEPLPSFRHSRRVRGGGASEGCGMAVPEMPGTGAVCGQQSGALGDDTGWPLRRGRDRGGGGFQGTDRPGN